MDLMLLLCYSALVSQALLFLFSSRCSSISVKEDGCTQSLASDVL